LSATTTTTNTTGGFGSSSIGSGGFSFGGAVPKVAASTQFGAVTTDTKTEIKTTALTDFASLPMTESGSTHVEVDEKSSSISPQ
jgi:hypothetical protein